ncbi:MFS transporter, partial [Acinetobacter baumannii]
AMRLVPDHQVPRALAVVNGGNALATVIAAPLGAFLGGLFGWRAAAFCVVPVAVIVFFWQLISLPTLKPAAPAGAGHAIGLLGRPLVAL